MKKTNILESARKVFNNDILSRESIIYMRSGRELSVFKCIGISEYSEELAVLDVIDGKISICGNSLMLKTFSTGDITIEGEIDTIRFIRG